MRLALYQIRTVMYMMVSVNVYLVSKVRDVTNVWLGTIAYLLQAVRVSQHIYYNDRKYLIKHSSIVKCY